MKFTIRDLLLVTVIVAILVAWWLDHRRQAAEIERFNSVVDLGDVNQEGVIDSVWPVPPSSSAPAKKPPKN